MRQLIKAGVAAMLLVALAGCTIPAWVLKSPPRTGNPFPDLEVVGDRDAATHLRAESLDGTFPLSAADTDILLVVLTDMYCRYCQDNTPALLELHECIRQHPQRDRIRMVALALGNSQFEANVLKEKYSLPFPVVADEADAFRDQLGRADLPAIYGIRRRDDGSLDAVTVVNGPLTERPELFLHRTLVRSGMMR